MKGENIICVHEVKANKASASYGILFIALALIGLFLVGYPFYSNADMTKINPSVVLGVFIAPAGFIGFLRSNYRSAFYFDVKNGRFKNVDGYGFMKWGKWKSIGEIEYVSVFRQPYYVTDVDNDKNMSIAFDVNLWDEKDRCVTLTSYDDKASSFNFAKRLATQLNIKMLDSTVPNDSVWVELEIKD